MRLVVLRRWKFGVRTVSRRSGGVRGSRRLFDLVANELIVSLTVYGCELEEWCKLLCNVFGLCFDA